MDEDFVFNVLSVIVLVVMLVGPIAAQFIPNLFSKKDAAAPK